MSSSLPVLEIFYINLSKPEKVEEIANFIKNPSFRIFSSIFPISSILYLKWLENKIGKSDYQSLKEIIEKNSFTIIRSKEELEEYTNPLQNEWIDTDKLLKRKQYYIRHPKKTKGNVLIEAQNFYKYIEDEQKNELIQFIKSHCSAKKIIIDRKEIKGTEEHFNVNINDDINGIDLNESMIYKKEKGNFYLLINPNGIPRESARDNYIWIDDSIKKSIESLTEGSSFSQSYQYDFKCGLTLKEAKTLGLDISMYKNFSYSIYVEC